MPSRDPIEDRDGEVDLVVQWPAGPVRSVRLALAALLAMAVAAAVSLAFGLRSLARPDLKRNLVLVDQVADRDQVNILHVL